MSHGVSNVQCKHPDIVAIQNNYSISLCTYTNNYNYTFHCSFIIAYHCPSHSVPAHKHSLHSRHTWEVLVVHPLQGSVFSHLSRPIQSPGQPSPAGGGVVLQPLLQHGLQPLRVSWGAAVNIIQLGARHSQPET